MTTQITSQTLHDFLSRLGRCYRHPGFVDKFALFEKQLVEEPS